MILVAELVKPSVTERYEQSLAQHVARLSATCSGHDGGLRADHRPRSSATSAPSQGWSRDRLAGLVGAGRVQWSVTSPETLLRWRLDQYELVQFHVVANDQIGRCRPAWPGSSAGSAAAPAASTPRGSYWPDQRAAARAAGP